MRQPPDFLAPAGTNQIHPRDRIVWRITNVEWLFQKPAFGPIEIAHPAFAFGRRFESNDANIRAVTYGCGSRHFFPQARYR